MSADEGELRRRVALHQSTGDLDVLWPHAPRAARRVAMVEIRRIVEGMLRDDGRMLVLSAANDQEARVLGVAAFTAGMGPLLGWWIEEGRVDCSPAVRERLAEHLAHGRRRSEALRGHASRIARAMHAVGLRPILLKGIHTGGEFFPHPSTRPSADIDVLVTPTERSQAESALAQLGFVQTKAVVADRADWSPRGARMEPRSVDLDHAENPWNVDLHQALRRFYFRGTGAELGQGAFATRRFIDVAGESVRVLDQPYLTAFLALHAGCDLAAVRLVRLYELVVMIRADAAHGLLDWKSIGSLLEDTKTGRFVYPALALAEELAPGTIDPSLLARLALGASPRMQRALAAVLRAGTGPLDERSFDVKLAWAAGPVELLMAVSELGLPSLRVSLAATLAQRWSVARWRIGRWFGRPRERG